MNTQSLLPLLANVWMLAKALTPLLGRNNFWINGAAGMRKLT
jgi:hypothetical protein